MNISYHAWKDYQECPQKYFWRYRKKLPPAEPKNEYYTLYGKLVERFFETYCNSWRYSTPVIAAPEIENRLRAIYDRVLRESIVDWTAPFIKATKDDIFYQGLGDILAIMNSPNKSYFLNTKSEVSIEIRTKEDAIVNGRIDFIMKLDGGKRIIIFDGKGTNEIGKNISDDQVLFYALLYFFHFKILAEQLGFFYYQFNTFKPVDISIPILNTFRQRLADGVKAIMYDATFAPTPTPKACKYCEYKALCKSYEEYQAAHRKESKLNLPYDGGVIGLSL